MSRHIKFHVPEEYRSFVLFKFLPIEIRQRIWEAYLSTPGIHFVRLQTGQGSWSWTEAQTPRAAAAVTATQQSSSEFASDHISRVVLSDDEDKEKHDVCFVPVAPCFKADVSHYKTLRRQLATLSQTCYESWTVVQRLCRRPDTLRVNDGQILCLGKSFDVVYLEYLPARLYQRSGNLESIPDCTGLQHIKRLAVRFSHTWTPPQGPCPCSSCKGALDDSRSGACPAHLYQFLVRHLPSLEEFFFVDYFIVHKSRAEPVNEKSLTAQATRCHKARFQAGNRLYHEANPNEWIMTKRVTQITEWLRESFVRYAMESALSVHQNPEKVRFSVLACEWNISPPVHRYKPIHKLPLRSKHARPRGLFAGPRKRCKLSNSVFNAPQWAAEATTPCSPESSPESSPETETETEQVMQMRMDGYRGREFTFTALPRLAEVARSESDAETGIAHGVIGRGTGLAFDALYRQLERGTLYLVNLLMGKNG
ncbi:hypothetical protein E4U17_004358 [Claviceps sp. LM77 group G4]|nr:hypothetical protein E4U17_004358 [Claviceps sp. LM77 group G4]KAG6071183.1 hypothetical protein E4U33_003847 [Claviceps sp. LM78 group G4]KAG6082968.1 hypothetical protein E4U16_005127 [Claviceps sp. LM84 group G4]